MKLAARFSENDLKDLVIDAMERHNKILITRDEIQFFRSYDPMARNPEQFVIQINLTRYENKVQHGQQILLNGEAK